MESENSIEKKKFLDALMKKNDSNNAKGASGHNVPQNLNENTHGMKRRVFRRKSG